MNEKVLELIFKYADGSKRTLSVSDPRETIAEAEAAAAMNGIIESQAFYSEAHGLLTGAVSARLRSTSVSVIASLED